METVGLIYKTGVYTDWLERVALDFINNVLQVLEHKERFLLAVSGGNTPYPLYEKLAGEISSGRLNHVAERLDVILVDERCVLPVHPDSNYGRLLKLWGHLKINLVPVIVGDDLEAVATQYDAFIRSFSKNGTIPIIDLVFLGIGNDGHTASLFPDSEALTEEKKIFMLNWVPSLNEYRLTLTFPILKKAKERWILCKGESKVSLLNSIISSGNSGFPIERLMMNSQNPCLRWYIVNS